MVDSDPRDLIDKLGDGADPPLNEEQLGAFKAFLRSVLPTAPRDFPPSVWHYTSGEGLVGILKSGRLFATHVTCLNDTLEYQYLARLLAEEAKARARTESDARLKHLYDASADSLAARDVDRAGVFVTCFSQGRDDLGQWRGYGGGDNSYAIEFDYKSLSDLIDRKRPGTSLLRASYDDERHRTIARALLDNQVSLAKRLSVLASEETQTWYATWGRAYAEAIDLLHAGVKHPKFEREQEFRIVAKLREGEEKDIQFRVKQALLSRHLELDWTDDGKLPILSVMVGPGRAQAVSKISVGDLLRKCGYGDSVLPVHISDVPFRTL